LDVHVGSEVVEQRLSMKLLPEQWQHRIKLSQYLNCL
jgi:hypothetical protein